jgi:hypothetical protein
MRKGRKYMQELHYVYKVTNTINGNFYIGKHSTMKPYDNYMGSGFLLKQAIRRYGIENFKKEIIQYCQTSKEAYDLEKELTKDIWQNPMCYNNKCGGGGGGRKYMGEC